MSIWAMDCLLLSALLLPFLGLSSLDFLSFLPAECIFQEADFYTKLVLKTVGPIIICTLLWLPFLSLFISKHILCA